MMTDQDLQEKLQEAQKQNNQKWWQNDDQDFSDLENEIWEIDQVEKIQKEVSKLQKDLQDQTEIASRAQRDYINLKLDFDRYQRQTIEKEKTMELMTLLSSVKKFLPFVEDLRKSLDNIPQEQKNDPLAQWVQLVYDNFLKTLNWINVFQIEAVWLEPDPTMHEPVSMIAVDDKKMKWKIVQEFERWFYYEKDGKKTVLTTSKVIVGQ